MSSAPGPPRPFGVWAGRQGYTALRSREGTSTCGIFPPELELSCLGIVRCPQRAVLGRFMAFPPHVRRSGWCLTPPPAPASCGLGAALPDSGILTQVHLLKRPVRWPNDRTRLACTQHRQGLSLGHNHRVAVHMEGTRGSSGRAGP